MSVAFFILATTKYWNARVEEIATHWGFALPHIYFVVGHSQKSDEEFSLRQCREDATTSNKNNPIALLACPVIDPVTQSMISNITVLYVRKCPDKYYGSSPTCRCQESMLYFLYSPSLQHVQWFMFLDDDVFIRAHALQGFLSEQNVPSHPKAYVGCIGGQKGLQFSKNYSFCVENRKDLPKFCWAMPAILNRLALVHMQPAIDSAMMMKLVQVWGNSHDVILGLVLWLYDIPSYSLNNYILKGYGVSWDFYLDLDELQKYFMIHEVKSPYALHANYMDFYNLTGWRPPAALTSTKKKISINSADEYTAMKSGKEYERTAAAAEVGGGEDHAIYVHTREEEVLREVQCGVAYARLTRQSGQGPPLANKKNPFEYQQADRARDVYLQTVLMNIGSGTAAHDVSAYRDEGRAYSPRPFTHQDCHITSDSNSSLEDPYQYCSDQCASIVIVSVSIMLLLYVLWYSFSGGRKKRRRDDSKSTLRLMK